MSIDIRHFVGGIEFRLRRQKREVDDGGNIGIILSPVELVIGAAQIGQRRQGGRWGDAGGRTGRQWDAGGTPGERRGTVFLATIPGSKGHAYHACMITDDL